MIGSEQQSATLSAKIARMPFLLSEFRVHELSGPDLAKCSLRASGVSLLFDWLLCSTWSRRPRSSRRHGVSRFPQRRFVSRCTGATDLGFTRVGWPSSVCQQTVRYTQGRGCVRSPDRSGNTCACQVSSCSFSEGDRTACGTSQGRSWNARQYPGDCPSPPNSTEC